ncbi:hypothetical protein CLOM_g9455 [Closterium sp. NIES-68]|nr:hypothetical protein CLOM_g9455 [Closterium sp. NIES-68]GJP75792.1 hypothetical protein CLOP_g6192 [Closterium sp. NIES-67]
MSNGLILAGSSNKGCSRDSRSSDGVGADVSSNSSSPSASPAAKSAIRPADASTSSSFFDSSPRAPDSISDASLPSARLDTPPPARSFLSLLPFASLSSKRQQQQQSSSRAVVSGVGGSLLDLLDEGWFSSNVAAWPNDYDLSTIQEAVNETEDDDNGDALPGATVAGKVACAHAELSAPSSASNVRGVAEDAAVECASASADDQTEPNGGSRSDSPEPDMEGSFGKYRRRRGRSGSRRRPKRSSSLDAARMSRRVSMPPHPPLPADEEQRDQIETRSNDGDYYERTVSPYAASGRRGYAEGRGSGGEHFSAFHPSPPFRWSGRGTGAVEAESGAGFGGSGSGSGGAGRPRYLRTRSVSDYESADYEPNSSLREGAFEAEAEAGGGVGLPLTPSARARSLTEADVEELRGFMDLGFKFRQADMSARMTATLPALRLYQAVGSVQQRLISRHHQHHHGPLSATAGATGQGAGADLAAGSTSPGRLSPPAGAAPGAAGDGAAGVGSISVPVGVGSGTCSPRISSYTGDSFVVSHSPEPHAVRGSSMPSSPRHIPSLVTGSSSSSQRHSQSQGQRGVSGSWDAESWSFANPQDPPSDVKTHLRLWAQAVASTVRQTC